MRHAKEMLAGVVLILAAIVLLFFLPKPEGGAMQNSTVVLESAKSFFSAGEELQFELRNNTARPIFYQVLFSGENRLGNFFKENSGDFQFVDNQADSLASQSAQIQGFKRLEPNRTIVLKSGFIPATARSEGGALEPIPLAGTYVLRVYYLLEVPPVQSMDGGNYFEGAISTDHPAMKKTVFVESNEFEMRSQ